MGFRLTNLTAIAIVGVTMLGSTLAFAQTAAKSDEYADFNPGKSDKGSEWTQAIEVWEPIPRSEVQGEVECIFRASGMAVARAVCWQQPTEASQEPWGHDVVLAEIKLGPKGNGKFIFPADKFPNGPISIRIYANNQDKTRKDYREIQVYNTGGVVWKQGLPAEAPSQSKGMKLLFSDDFDKSLSISADGEDATYQSHKPGGGDFSGWVFSDFEGETNPFAQVGTFLRIRGSQGSDGKASSGLITPVRADWSGVYAAVPYYMECRFVAQSAPGTWPAFWTLSRGGQGSDELDVIEAYGGFGKGNPNYTGYSTTSHFWNQKTPDGQDKKAIGQPHDMLAIGGKSSWSHTFHNYGLLVTETDTIYYLDGIETMRHPTNELSKTAAHYFLIDYAIGGISGWPIDLKREGNASDMYIDWVRVYSGKPAPMVETLVREKPAVASNGIGLNFAVPNNKLTEMRPNDVAGEGEFAQRQWNNLSGPRGADVAVRDAAGKPVDGMAVTWSAANDNDAVFAREWGFNAANLRMQRGVLANNGTLAVKGVPYKKYDIVLYFNAGDNHGKGKVILSIPGGESQTTYYHVGWTGGKFTRSTAKAQADAKDVNYVVFPGVDKGAFELKWDGQIEGGYTGLAGVQIVESGK
jgi:hypothetical protein